MYAHTSTHCCLFLAHLDSIVASCFPARVKSKLCFQHAIIFTHLIISRCILPVLPFHRREDLTEIFVTYLLRHKVLTRGFRLSPRRLIALFLPRTPLLRLRRLFLSSRRGATDSARDTGLSRSTRSPWGIPGCPRSMTSARRPATCEGSWWVKTATGFWPLVQTLREGANAR